MRSLPFLDLLVGIWFAVVFNLASLPQDARIAAAAKGKPAPEVGFLILCPCLDISQAFANSPKKTITVNFAIGAMVIGGVLFAIGLFLV